MSEDIGNYQPWAPPLSSTPGFFHPEYSFLPMHPHNNWLSGHDDSTSSYQHGLGHLGREDGHNDLLAERGMPESILPQGQR